MKKRKELTEEQEVFIRENRLVMSINDMSSELEISPERIRGFLCLNNLKLTNKEIDNIRRSKRNVQPKKINKEVVQEQEPKPYYFDFWNHNINPITMYKLNNYAK